MKYCSKCGNELLDEAVICPKCGCAVEAVPSMTSSANQLLKVSKQGKITTAMILIIIAFVLSLVSCLICWQGGYANPDFGFIKITSDPSAPTDESYKNQKWYQDKVKEAAKSNQKLVLAIGAWIALSVGALILGILAAKKAKQGQKFLIYTYMLSSLAGPLCAFAIYPNFLIMFICGIGLFLLVPPVLQMIAGGKLLQAAAISE